MTTFLSTLSLRRATDFILCHSRSPPISIHALLAESDLHFLHSCFMYSVFLSTLSLRRATAVPCRVFLVFLISIHALLAESDVASRRAVQVIDISIHALLAESDCSMLGTSCQACISIHALLAESDFTCAAQEAALTLFLSTLSLRRATVLITPKSATI